MRSAVRILITQHPLAVHYLQSSLEFIRVFKLRESGKGPLRIRVISIIRECATTQRNKGRCGRLQSKAIAGLHNPNTVLLVSCYGGRRNCNSTRSHSQTIGFLCEGFGSLVIFPDRPACRIILRCGLRRLRPITRLVGFVSCVGSRYVLRRNNSTIILALIEENIVGGILQLAPNRERTGRRRDRPTEPSQLYFPLGNIDFLIHGQQQIAIHIVG